MAVISPSEDTLKMKEAFSQDKEYPCAACVGDEWPAEGGRGSVCYCPQQEPVLTDLVSDEVTNQKHSGRCWMFAGLNVAVPSGEEAQC